jgi:hypothetical protein
MGDVGGIGARFGWRGKSVGLGANVLDGGTAFEVR